MSASGTSPSRSIRATQRPTVDLPLPTDPDSTSTGTTSGTASMLRLWPGVSAGGVRGQTGAHGDIDTDGDRSRVMIRVVSLEGLDYQPTNCRRERDRAVPADLGGGGAEGGSRWCDG